LRQFERENTRSAEWSPISHSTNRCCRRCKL
jgi:hypothetical protein